MRRQTVTVSSEGPACPTRTHSCSGSILTSRVQQTKMDGILTGYDGILLILMNPDAFLILFLLCLCLQCLNSRDVNASVILPRNVYAVQTVLHHIPGLAPRFLYANPGAMSWWKHHITRCSLLSAVETLHTKVFHAAGCWVCPKLRPSMITLVKMLAAQSVLGHILMIV